MIGPPSRVSHFLSLKSLLRKNIRNYWHARSIYIHQSTQGLCKMNHDNLMTIGFVEDEMALKATLLVCVLIVISKALVSCVTSPKERL